MKEKTATTKRSGNRLDHLRVRWLGTKAKISSICIWK